ncbi:MAG: threonine synthase [Selenomonadaceae bacterium]|nr:threonine synthase [Selenomonadaceae bacterium]
MKYISTRSKIKPVNSAEAILQGLAPDGGLFVPESIPKMKLEEIGKLVGLPYAKCAGIILQKFLTDYTEDELFECAELAYNWFDVSAKVPLSILVNDPKNPKFPIGVAELWHGPTYAFKDLALQILPRLMTYALRKTGETKEILILVATSGDTGKAALAGFADVPQTKIMVFYPNGGVSKIQRLQMVTQVGDNVNVTAVNGNFDDAQTGVKKIFSDEKIREQLAAANIKLSSANSINWGRLVPQIAYYFSSYAEFVKSNQLKLGDVVNIVVPTGNFGNILAAYYAKRMGLPVKRLICASNVNNVLTEFFRTGVYNRNREFHKTISPSMDILISSNLERLLYHEAGHTDQIKRFMTQLNTTGKYKIDTPLKKKLDKIFYADFATEEETANMIKEVFGHFKYIVDPHTAVALKVLSNYRRDTRDMTPIIIASTASAFKFTSSVLTALGENIDGIDDLKQLDKLEIIAKKRIPKNLAKLNGAKILHEDVCEKEEMTDRVLTFAANKNEN